MEKFEENFNKKEGDDIREKVKRYLLHSKIERDLRWEYENNKINIDEYLKRVKKLKEEYQELEKELGQKTLSEIMEKIKEEEEEKRKREEQIE
jgi:response regulator of citrate/malate metabolism